MSEELATIYPSPRSLMVAGRLVEVCPLGLAHIQQFATFLGPAFGNVRAFLGSLDDGVPEALSIICIATGQDAAFAQSLSGLERLSLVVDILEVNQDVFPQVLAQLERLYRALDSMGGQPRSSSSPTKASKLDGIPRKPSTPSSPPSSAVSAPALQP